MMNQNNCVQQKMMCVTMENLMPQGHFLRQLDRFIDFSFIYQRVEHMYSQTGRRSIDPVVIVKMLLLGYLYGINSERRLEKEIEVNIAYRWFLGIDLDEAVPDHSTLSQLRRRKFKGSTIFEEIFAEIVKQCIEYELVGGKLLLTDSTHVRANVRNDISERILVDIEPSAYLSRLNDEARRDGILCEENEDTKPAKQKEQLKSPTDPDAGFMKRPGKPLGFHYLSHQTCDGKHGIITDVCVTPGNATDASVHSERIKHQIDTFGFQPDAVCADAGYDSSEIHKDMLDKGIQTYIPQRAPSCGELTVFSIHDFEYDEESDSLTCPNGCKLVFSTYRKKLGCKRYKSTAKQCNNCPIRENCISGTAKYKEVERTYHKSATDKQHRANGSPEYLAAMRLRKIWCEGNFSHQKANHNLARLRKRGLGNAYEHCLLSATALNLKRMVRLLNHSPENLIWLKILRMPRNIWTSAIFMPLCQQLHSGTHLPNGNPGPKRRLYRKNREQHLSNPKKNQR